ncbi:MAG: hypothetical protein GF388_02455 [Candidatus Aegiribacteria sp.]|nr:hypothetical protein [Candidatus Aegiribacteria sp.]
MTFTNQLSEELKQKAKALEARYRGRCVKRGIPSHMHDGIVGYLVYGQPTGSFLNHVLHNRLVDSLGKADSENLRAIYSYGDLLYNDFPMSAWRTEENVDRWIESGGLIGQELKKEENDGTTA